MAASRSSDDLDGVLDESLSKRLQLGAKFVDYYRAGAATAVRVLRKNAETITATLGDKAQPGTAGSYYKQGYDAACADLTAQLEQFDWSAHTMAVEARIIEHALNETEDPNATD